MQTIFLEHISKNNQKQLNFEFTAYGVSQFYTKTVGIWSCSFM